MKKTYLQLRLILFTLLSILAFNDSFATHVAGGYINYECTGNPNEYIITVTLYRDCSGVPAPNHISTLPEYDPFFCIPLGDPMLSFQNDCALGDPPNDDMCDTGPFCGTEECLKLELVHSEEVSQLCENDIQNSTCNGGSLPGFEKYVYQTTVTLPPCDGWTVTFELCCRNPATNVQNADGANFVMSTTIYTEDNQCNTTPAVTAAPQPYVCVNENVSYNLGAFEPDGDSIVFSLVDAYATPTNTVNYQAGYSGVEPIPGITINPNTGAVNFTPTVTGNFIVVIQMNEYNENGNLLSTTNYDFQFTVQNCSNNSPNNNGNGVINIDGAAILEGPDEISMCLNETTCLDLVFSDDDPDDVLTVTSNLENIFPNATMTLDGDNPVTATVCFDALDEEETNVVTFLIQDGACPIQGQNNYTLTVNSIECDGCFLNVNANVINCMDIEGSLSFINAPETGQLIIQDCYGDQIIIDPPFETGEGFLFDNLPEMPDECEITAWFTDQVEDENCEGSIIVGFEEFLISLNVTPDILVECPTDDPFDLFANASGGSEPYTFIWYDDENLTNQIDTGDNIAVDPENETTTYYVQVEGGCGETTTESVTITFDLPDPLTIDYDDEVIQDCPSDEVSISLNDIQGGNEPYTIIWEDASGTTIDNDTMATAVLPNETTTYTVTVMDDCGDEVTGEITVTVDYDGVQVILDDEYTIECPGDEVILTAEAFSGTEPYQYSWSNGDMGAEISVYPESETSFTVTVTDACGDQTTATTTVFLMDYDPLLVTVDDVQGCPESFATVTAEAEGGAGEYTYNWPQLEGVDSEGNTASFLMGEEGSTFNMTVIDKCGNFAQAIFEIEVVNCDIIIPNVITPNNDGVNDAFHVRNLEFHPNTQLRIFNRWGNLVFETNDYDNDWRGVKNNGTDLSDGTYFYILTLTTDSEVFEGTVKISRGK